MLTVGIHENNDTAGCIAGAGLYGSAVAEAVGMGKNPHATFFSQACGSIVGSIVNEQYFSFRINPTQSVK